MRLPIMIDYVEIPNGVNVSIEDGKIYIKGPKGEKYRNINNRNIIIEIRENKIIFKAYFPSKKIIRDMNTMVAHIKNDIEGVTKGFVYKLKGVSIHFPLKLKLQNNKLIIENYMGGRDIKEIEIPEGVKATLKENEITLEGYDIEVLGNLAGLIENSVKPKEKDLRKFQDGIYIIQKP
ncbi:50S ribosomal protein L6 [Candidatus Nanobsidianus stetteri]|uniref:50S ribosomal protein L6 n=1 Tax=Nanobsidianus stetteri TaxID=1294122 RepID=A0A2T9WKR4_NANST|nr:50S ribosomal protein L6 [Candidatus Nanobsidianus stetteri]MCC5447111.1 50S ribosomal protein L6 [Candidatus Nanobsidianus stetteri]